MLWYDKDKNYIEGLNTYANRVKTAPANACYARLTIWASGSGDVDTFGFNYPATDTQYHSYTGNTYTIAFGQTVYGGVLDVTRGKLHVTHNKRTFNGSETWYYSSTYNRVYTNIADTKINSAFISNVLTNSQTVADYNGYINDQKNLIIYAPASITSSADWETWLGSNPLEVCYELATPFDIDLTPEVISAVVGTNNVFADCGEMEVKYVDKINDISDLDDVQITSPTSGQFLKYDGAKWVNGNGGGGGGGVSDLDDLDDVSISSATSGQVLTYNGATWENADNRSWQAYSTTEQVVGTWIDGSIVYEKCIILNNGIDIQVSNTNWTDTGVTFADVDKFIDAFGIGNDGSYQGQILAYTDNDILKLQTPRNDVGWVAILYVRYTKSST
jgi:hypothetical protein